MAQGDVRPVGPDSEPGPSESRQQASTASTSVSLIAATLDLGPARSEAATPLEPGSLTRAQTAIKPGSPATGSHAAVMVNPTLLEPTRIGRYMVVRCLGQGGMGTVYSAYDPDLDRKVAVKVVREDVHRGALARERLVKEAKAMARIAHPNVVHVYEVGEDRDVQNGQIFIAMEFVPGVDLVDWQNQHPVRDASSLDRCLRMYLQAAQGLQAAHQSGLIHRE